LELSIVNFSGISDQGFVGRVLRVPLRLVPSRATVPILQGTLRGKKWIVGSSTHGCWLGSYEWEKQRRFAAAVPIGGVVYDVGAHVGFYTLLSSVLVGPEGRVLAFEPVPRNLGFLQPHVEMNECENVTVIASAVGERTGSEPFSLGPESQMGHLDANGHLDVSVVCLDDIVAGGCPPPDLIKIDIEGGEYRALRGARRVLESARPTIFLATHGPEVHEQCVKLVTSAGYRIEVLDSPDELLCTAAG
jgi:FkbM family methyltransferase